MRISCSLRLVRKAALTAETWLACRDFGPVVIGQQGGAPLFVRLSLLPGAPERAPGGARFPPEHPTFCEVGVGGPGEA